MCSVDKIPQERFSQFWCGQNVYNVLTVLVYDLHSATGKVKRRDGSVVGASDLGSEGPDFESRPVHPRCFLRQNT